MDAIGKYQTEASRNKYCFLATVTSIILLVFECYLLGSNFWAQSLLTLQGEHTSTYNRFPTFQKVIVFGLFNHCKLDPFEKPIVTECESFTDRRVFNETNPVPMYEKL